MSTIIEKVKAMRERERQRALDWECQCEIRRQEADAQEMFFNQKIRPLLRSATPYDYAAWLKGYMERGGEPTHCYEYPMPDRFYIALADFKLPALFGTASVRIIVPTGINITSNVIGHNTIYLMDSFDLCGSWVPLYSDLKF